MVKPYHFDTFRAALIAYTIRKHNQGLLGRLYYVLYHTATVEKNNTGRCVCTILIAKRAN